MGFCARNTLGFQIGGFTIVPQSNRQENIAMGEDLSKYFKYKSFMLVLFCVLATAAALGPFLFSNIYYMMCVTVLTYCCLKYTQMFGIIIYIYFKFRQGMQDFKKGVIRAGDDRITHVFILPNFKEDLQILKETIECLKSHSAASKYCVMLAMEKHEKDSDKKAQKLVQEYSKYFRVMSYTQHELVEGEAKSKSSNINWCTHHMVPMLVENGIKMDQVFITIMDADSLIPEQYTALMEDHILKNYDNRHKFIYQPPQIFTRNAHDAPFFIFTIDTLMSYMHCSNLYSMFGYTMAVSNYSLSYGLLERIDFWDTCEFSRGEDVRITAKAYWKTDGETTTVPIYAPANQLSISTGMGYIADLKARFHQARRHCQVQIEVSYNLVNLMERKFNIRNFHVFYTIFEVYMMVVTIPVHMIALFLQEQLQILPMAPLDDGLSLFKFNIVSVPVLIIGFVFYELMKRQATKDIFNIPNQSLIRSFLVPPLGTLFGLIYGFVPMILAGLSLSKNQMIYTVAPKGLSKNTPNQGSDQKLEEEDQSFADQPEPCIGSCQNIISTKI